MGDARRGLAVDERNQVLAKAGYRCAICRHRFPPERLQVDHVVEVADGGTDDPGNLQVLCKRHHAMKTRAAERARRRPSADWCRRPAGALLIAAAVASATDRRVLAVTILAAGLGCLGLVVGVRHARWAGREATRAKRIAERDGQRGGWAVPAVQPTPEPVASPLEAALTSLCRGPVTITRHGKDRMVIGYPATFRDDSDQARADFLDIIHAKVPGRWRPEWDTHTNRVTMHQRPVMPHTIMRPPNPGSRTSMPFGIDENGQAVIWRPDRVPHVLVAGGTGSGKSNLIRGLALSAIEAGWDVRPCDPKRVELIGLRDLVPEVATTEEAMIAMVERTHDEMMFRYAAIEAGEVTTEDLRPILLIVDEAMVFVQQLDEFWRDNKRSGMSGTSHPVIRKWQKIAILGRSARVLLLTGMQRPDAALLGDKAGGATRDQYGVRIALGPMSPDGSRMMFNRSDVGRDIPREVQGRATAAVGDGEPREVQVWYCP